jgi:hypothetical protein
MSAMPPANMQEFAQQVTECGKTDLHLALRFGDYDLAIATNSSAMIEKLRHIYRHFLDDAPTSRFAIRIIDVPAAPDLAWRSAIACLMTQTMSRRTNFAI